MINAFASFLESTTVAVAIRQSVLLTGFLSGLHLVGMTLIGGCALVSGMRTAGIAFVDFRASEVTRVARRGIAVGVTISIISGLLLVAPRATRAIVSEYFQLKMLLLAGALLCHLVIYRPITKRPGAARPIGRLSGAMSAALWFAVILAGCAYILLEG